MSADLDINLSAFITTYTIIFIVIIDRNSLPYLLRIIAIFQHFLSKIITHYDLQHRSYHCPIYNDFSTITTITLILFLFSYFAGRPRASSTGMITMVTIIAGVLGVVALALIIVVAIILKRKQAPPKPQKLLVNDVEP